jgi:hypothetical protein
VRREGCGSRRTLFHLTRTRLRAGLGTGSLDVASAYARVGDKEKSLEWLQKAYEERNGDITLVNSYPDYKSLHGDPRFSALLKRIGLPD